jgi:radical SAM superfamily enzyme YgiQ (UPF0313 family)
MPNETFNECEADVVLLNSNVDFILKDLVIEIASNNNWKETAKTPGVIIRIDKNKFKENNNFRLVEDLNLSPDIDRDLVQWKNYAYENGNFLRTPGTYATSVIRDCSFGKCTFCRYNGPEFTYSQRSVEKSISECDKLINHYKVKEIFDDSGVWFRGATAKEFCDKFIDRGLHKKAYFGINTRFGYLDEETVKSMSKANFRFVLLGMEAADDFTLNKLKKGYSTDAIIKNLKLLTKYGLHPHLTMMVGYYWQTQEMLDQTVNFVKQLMRNGLARTLQVTICIPLDYTPYHRECLENDMLLTSDYDDFNMSKVIVKTPIPKERYYEAIKKILDIIYDPQFLMTQVKYFLKFKKRDMEFLTKYSIRALRRVRNVKKSLTSFTN